MYFRCQNRKQPKLRVSLGFQTYLQTEPPQFLFPYNAKHTQFGRTHCVLYSPHGVSTGVGPAILGDVCKLGREQQINTLGLKLKKVDEFQFILGIKKYFFFIEKKDVH